LLVNFTITKKRQETVELNEVRKTEIVFSCKISSLLQYRLFFVLFTIKKKHFTVTVWQMKVNIVRIYFISYKSDNFFKNLQPKRMIEF